MKKEKMRKRLTILCMAFAMALVLVPMTALAEEGDEDVDDGKSGDFTYEEVEDDTAEITGYHGSASILAIPSQVDGKTVISIGEDAFARTDIAVITIPATVEVIGDGAFSECGALKNIIVPGSVESIGEGAFEGCDGLTAATLQEGIKELGNKAFKDCVSLTGITIPSSIESIGDNAFEGCSSLKNVTIKKGVESIGDNAFSGCESLVAITIPDSVTYLGDYAFEGCSSLKDAAIPDSVEDIGKDLFKGCDQYQPEAVSGNSKYQVTGKTTAAYVGSTKKNEKSVTVPSKVKILGKTYKVTSIAKGAFKNNKNLKSVKLGANVDTIEAKAFYKCTKLAKVTLPAKVKKIGKQAFAGCKNLKSIVVKSTKLTKKNVGSKAFSGIYKKAKIKVPKKNLASYQALFRAKGVGKQAKFANI